MPSDHRDPGSICDVDGVLVGHHQRTGRGWQTGTTAVVIPSGAVAAVDVRGGGPGTRETDALAPGNLVDRVHAICLSGGSAFGLAAADGVMAVLEERGLGVPVGPGEHDVVPVVPVAVIFDLARGGKFRNRPDATFGERAARRASRSDRRGTIGAGTGARAGGLQGGVGMASAAVDPLGVTVAALAVVNASGSVIDPASARPWCDDGRTRRPSGADKAALRKRLTAATAPPQPLNTTIGVVATDAALTRPEAGRLALASHDGLSRAIRPAHALTDGDAIFGLSTGAIELAHDAAGLVRAGDSRAAQLNAVFAVAADVFARACTDAVLSAESIGDAPAYRDVCPTAF
ncbi:MAG: P1 family peptidase [Ilumatobacter sp.]|uniref:P1 family peptidase n=1 Tax=Ilumatobacter sp. TaxID=1967498 RepID=UPI0026230806|nr:P1 family peptidase [Ilumatobacter sp.]MDJ0767483.1 P1 family peptidase [Ilumatobacter sp.]